MNFFQLNTITSYDFGKSIIRIDKYAKRAKDLSYLAIASCDSNIFSYASLEKECLKENLKPIYGLRIRLASRETNYINACLYIKNEGGYLNICKILSEKEGNIGIELLKKYKDGLILIIDCDNPSFFDNYYLNLINKDLYQYSKLFEDDFYLGVELYSKNDIDESKVLYDYALDKYKTVAFPKVLYLKKNENDYLNILSCFINDKQYLKEDDEGPYFLLSENALKQIYREKDLIECENIINKIDFTFTRKRGELISFVDDKETLKKEALEGLKNKDLLTDERYLKRLEYELKVIEEMNFSSYLLLVSDYVNYAKSHNIKVGPARGSAGGCLTCYALNITEIDPIKYGLSFERFLNPKRSNMPDIDVDIENSKRGEVITYLKNKYGDRHVSDIITFTTLKPKSALNMVAKITGFNESNLKRLTSLISDSSKTFEDALNDNYRKDDLNELLKDSYFLDIVKLANNFLSIPVNTSIHAAGIIISKNEIYKTCPVSDKTQGTVYFEYPTMEKQGFLKVDILGLANLSFIKDIEDEIDDKELKDNDFKIPLDDKKTFEVLNKLHTRNIFQLENYGMIKTIQLVKPTNFYDIAAIIALYRPGPIDNIPTYAKRKNENLKITYKTPLLENILKETYGIFVYQEQVIKAVSELALFDAADADLFRRAISKKDISKMEIEKNNFISGCKKNNIDEKVAIDIFDDIEKFASYGFNKSHAYAYALICYRLLYYKANYPIPFYKVSFKSCSLNSEDADYLLKELSSLGYNLKNPDINKSLEDELLFENNDIYLPLNAIAGINSFFLKRIIEKRKEGNYLDFYSFISRLEIENNDESFRNISALIESGALDSIYKSREALKNVLKDYLDFAHLGFEKEQLKSLKPVMEDIADRLYLEKQRLGRIVSEKLEDIVSQKDYLTFIISDISKSESGQYLTLEDCSHIKKIEVNKTVSADKNAFILIKINKPTRKTLIYPQKIIYDKIRRKIYE